MNKSELVPSTSAKFASVKSSSEYRRRGVEDATFAGVSSHPSLLSASASDRSSRVARITKLSNVIQSRLRGPMHELERYLESAYCAELEFKAGLEMALNFKTSPRYRKCPSDDANARTLRSTATPLLIQPCGVRSHRLRATFFSMRRAVYLELTSCVCHQK